MRSVTFGVLFALIALLARAGALAAETKVGDHVVLRSGRILAGRVVGTTRHEKSRLLRIETDFGEILVPQREVKKRVAALDKKTKAQAAGR